LFCLFLLSGCEQKPQQYQHSILKFGTIIDVTIYGVDETVAQKAFSDLDRDFAYYHAAWTPYEPSSLTRINSLIPTGKTFSIGPSVFPLIENSMQLAIATDHLYNPAIGKLIKLWQMHKHEEPDIRPPDADKIGQLLRQQPRITDLHLEGIQMRSDNPAVELNFGAYAKGYGIDLSIKHLKELGINHAIINTGGDLKAIGRHGDRPWTIAVRHPRQDAILASLQTSGEEAVFTSGDYERYYMYQGKRYHHIIDPRTGYPAEGTQSVTVIHKDSGLADAAATALFVAGPEHWYELARKLGLKQVLLVDAEGKIHVSPQMQQRLNFNERIETTLIVSPPL
jgi:thiamine biosynthesis lipoprotein